MVGQPQDRRRADQPDDHRPADLVRGDYEFAGREFDIERGIIRFDGSVPANPSLDIAANANTHGLNATIRVTGNAEKPEIGFTSVPALPEDELLSRLLFGTSITSLSAPEALQLASAVAALNSAAAASTRSTRCAAPPGSIACASCPPTRRPGRAPRSPRANI